MNRWNKGTKEYDFRGTFTLQWLVMYVGSEVLEPTKQQQQKSVIILLHIEQNCAY